MKIENTTYYEKSTEYFRAFPRSDSTEWSEDGFTYIGVEIAVGFRRASKSNYEVTILYGGEVSTVIKHSIAAAAELAARAVQRAEE